MQSSFYRLKTYANYLPLGRSEYFAASCGHVLCTAAPQPVSARASPRVFRICLLVLGGEQVLVRLRLVTTRRVLASLCSVFGEVVKEAVRTPVLGRHRLAASGVALFYGCRAHACARVVVSNWPRHEEAVHRRALWRFLRSCSKEVSVREQRAHQYSACRRLSRRQRARARAFGT